MSVPLWRLPLVDSITACFSMFDQFMMDLGVVAQSDRRFEVLICLFTYNTCLLHHIPRTSKVWELFIFQKETKWDQFQNPETKFHHGTEKATNQIVNIGFFSQKGPS